MLQKSKTLEQAQVAELARKLVIFKALESFYQEPTLAFPIAVMIIRADVSYSEEFDYCCRGG